MADLDVVVVVEEDEDDDDVVVVVAVVEAVTRGFGRFLLILLLGAPLLTLPERLATCGMNANDFL